MAQTVKHVKVSGVPDGGDAAQVQPSDWNADHAITGTVAYSEVSGKPSTFPPTLPIAESDVTSLVADLALKAPLASPTFTGNPLAPTPAAADSDTSVATTAHVHAAIAADVVRASTTEILTGTDAAKVVTPDALAALWELGDQAMTNAASLVLGEGSNFNVSLGSPLAVTSITFQTPKDGRQAWVRFGVALIGTVITNSTNLIMPGGEDFITKNGDQFLFQQVGAGQLRCLAYMPVRATTTDVLTGTDATKVVTPDALAALWENGAAVPAAATLTIGEGGVFFIQTGTAVPVTAIAWNTFRSGRSAKMVVNIAGLSLVNSANLILPGGANITCAVGDTFIVFAQSATIARVVSYQPYNGKPVVMPTKADVGLGSVDNTSDVNKPVSTAQAAADALKADLASPSFTGLVTVGGGQIAFPAAQNASAGVNVLDDYEEGTWTPALTFAGAAVGMTYSFQSGGYVKVGKLVTCTCFFQLSAKGSSVGNMLISGLPFTADGRQQALSMWAQAMTSGVGDSMLSGVVSASATTLIIYKQNVGNAVRLVDTDFTNTSSLNLNFSYTV